MMSALELPMFVPVGGAFVSVKDGQLYEGRARGAYYVRFGEDWFRLGYAHDLMGESLQTWLPMKRPPKGWPHAWHPGDNVVSLDAWRGRSTKKPKK